MKLNDFICKNKILNEGQYGFTTGRSTSLAILDLIEHITDEKNQIKSTIGVFIVLENAFETIDYDMLLGQLHHYGMHGVILEWISSYLNNREQYVQFGDTISNNRNIDCGIPHTWP